MDISTLLCVSPASVPETMTARMWRTSHPDGVDRPSQWP